MHRWKISVRFKLELLFSPSAHSIVVFFPVGLSSLSRDFQQVLLGVEVSPVSWLGQLTVKWDDAEKGHSNLILTKQRLVQKLNLLIILINVFTITLRLTNPMLFYLRSDRCLPHVRTMILLVRENTGEIFKTFFSSRYSLSDHSSSIFPSL